ncbi:glutaredoxin domain-containing protein [Pseudozobellia sp. WGM2]|uniref:glutaredoxin family protein n=1 Tax=Pseudozobellia sp. WGM2 TaxID=2787625 RepID=UPI001AE007E9|nr:glutaredoxin domain-containing protein [Pseudozobellia sp. WGM2]
MKDFLITCCLTLFLSVSCLGQEVTLDNEQDSTSKTNAESIIIYGSDTCHFCLDTKSFLTSKQIEFTYYDVDINIVKQREMLIKVQKAGLSTDQIALPVIDKNGQLFMNDSDFEAFLNKIAN